MALFGNDDKDHKHGKVQSFSDHTKEENDNRNSFILLLMSI